MFVWALMFFILCFITGVVGFGGMLAVPAAIAQMLFFVFLSMMAITFGAFLMRA